MSQGELKVEDISFYYQEMLRSNLSELEIETPQGKLTLKRCSCEVAAVPAAAPHSQAARRAPAEPKQEAASAGLKVIKSPITGILYQASSPQSPPFVKQGDTVKAGATLCLVEAMKVMNEIKAEAPWRIVKILGENGKPVAKDQDLFHVEPL